jgi:hypothetical protein
VVVKAFIYINRAVALLLLLAGLYMITLQEGGFVFAFFGALCYFLVAKGIASKRLWLVLVFSLLIAVPVLLYDITLIFLAMSGMLGAIGYVFFIIMLALPVLPIVSIFVTLHARQVSSDLPIETPWEAVAPSEDEEPEDNLTSELSKVGILGRFEDTFFYLIPKWFKDAKSTSEKVGIVLVIVTIIFLFVAIKLASR